jgi:PPM family protein phosphatase
MNVKAGNAQHIGARQQQEDAFGFTDPSDKTFVCHGGFLGVIADGMGGLTQGGAASTTAVRSFLASYQAKTPKESVVDALLRSLLEANRIVHEKAESASSGDAGTTLAAAVVLNEELYWISVGDSRIYWLHNNELTRLTADHIYSTKLNRDVAQGKISRSDAQNHVERASLTSYLGHLEPTLVDRNLRPLLLHDNDCVVLCSDGFYRGLSDVEIADSFQGNPQHACDSLVQLVLEKDRKHQDNLTVIALKARRSARAFRGLSAHAQLYLFLALCIVLLAGAAGVWFAQHPFIRNSSAPKVQKGPPPPPITVSKPTVLAPSNSPERAATSAQTPKQTDPQRKNAGSMHEQGKQGKSGSSTKSSSEKSADHKSRSTSGASSSAHQQSGTPKDRSSQPSTTNDQQDQDSPTQTTEPEQAPPNLSSTSNENLFRSGGDNLRCPL